MTRVVSLRPDYWAALMLSGLSAKLWWEYMGPTATWGSFCWQGVSCIPLVPPVWFKADAWVGHSLAMWPHPWHLKHWREFGSHLLAVPSLLVLVPWLPWPLLPVPLPLPHAQWVSCRLGWSVQSHFYHCGRLGVLLPLWPLPC